MHMQLHAMSSLVGVANLRYAEGICGEDERMWPLGTLVLHYPLHMNHWALPHSPLILSVLCLLLSLAM